MPKINKYKDFPLKMGSFYYLNRVNYLIKKKITKSTWMKQDDK